LRALAQTPGVHLAVAGGLEGSPYPAMARQLGLSERVHWLGFRRDVDALMRAADLFVFPSRYEPFALVILEAMASGLPLITASTVGAAELVTPDCGLIVSDPEDAGALAEALRELSADGPLRQRMGCAARGIAEGCRWEQMADRYLALYAQTAQESGRRERAKEARP
jgi:glycosyltransferase involved in cell wall biosynthesis